MFLNTYQRDIEDYFSVSLFLTKKGGNVLVDLDENKAKLKLLKNKLESIGESL